MDFGLAPSVATALHDAIDRGMAGYPFPSLERDVADAATTFWVDRFDWRVPSDWVFAAPDVVTGMRRAIETLTPANSPVIVHSPIYYPFYGMIADAGRDTIAVDSQVDPDGTWRLDLDAIDAAFTNGAGSIALCNPWNPTGRVFTETELGDVAEIATRHGALILSDEIHGPIVYAGNTHRPIAPMAPEHVVTVTAASKAWNIPGLKAAQVVLTNQEHRDTWTAVYPPEKVGVGILGLVASVAAYQSGVPWFDSVLDRLTHNRDLVTSLVESHLPRAGYSPPEGTYLAWIDLVGYKAHAPAKLLLDEAGVAVSDGGLFGSATGSAIRVNFATDPAVLTEIFERMAGTLVDSNS